MISHEFLTPVANLTMQDNEIIHDLEEKKRKLQLFRQRLNAVAFNIVNIKSLNMENKKNFNILKNKLQGNTDVHFLFIFVCLGL